MSARYWYNHSYVSSAVRSLHDFAQPYWKLIGLARPSESLSCSLIIATAHGNLFNNSLSSRWLYRSWPRAQCWDRSRSRGILRHIAPRCATLHQLRIQWKISSSASFCGCALRCQKNFRMPAGFRSLGKGKNTSRMVTLSVLCIGHLECP